MASPFKYNRLNIQEAAVLLVDFQTGLISLVQDYPPEVFRNNIRALAKVEVVSLSFTLYLFFHNLSLFSHFISFFHTLSLFFHTLSLFFHSLSLFIISFFCIYLFIYLYLVCKVLQTAYCDNNVKTRWS